MENEYHRLLVEHITRLIKDNSNLLVDLVSYIDLSKFEGPTEIPEGQDITDFYKAWIRFRDKTKIIEAVREGLERYTKAIKLQEIGKAIAQIIGAGTGDIYLVSVDGLYMVVDSDGKIRVMSEEDSMKYKEIFGDNTLIPPRVLGTLVELTPSQIYVSLMLEPKEQEILKELNIIFPGRIINDLEAEHVPINRFPDSEGPKSRRKGQKRRG